MNQTQYTISSLLTRLHFDTSSGKVYRMYKGPDDPVPKEYELPLTDAYLSSAFNPDGECPDFFAEDMDHMYFAVPPLPGEKVVVCKAKRSSRQLVPFDTAKVRHNNEIIQLKFSKMLTLEVAEVVDGTTVVFWREARIAAIGDSVDIAVSRASILLVNRLVETTDAADIPYGLRADILITTLLHEKSINVAIHCTEVPDPIDAPTLLDDPATDSTGLVEYAKDPPTDKETDPNYN